MYFALHFCKPLFLWFQNWYLIIIWISPMRKKVYFIFSSLSHQTFYSEIILDLGAVVRNNIKWSCILYPVLPVAPTCKIVPQYYNQDTIHWFYSDFPIFTCTVVLWYLWGIGSRTHHGYQNLGFSSSIVNPLYPRRSRILGFNQLLIV